MCNLAVKNHLFIAAIAFSETRKVEMRGEGEGDITDINSKCLKKALLSDTSLRQQQQQ